ncbi:MAG: hypothetical protein NTW86_33240 [Candidatus Sumerlaeota bacterium]|nr:hypothetical protein [Candidatus Sumerlaeota bacterium]
MKPAVAASVLFLFCLCGIAAHPATTNTLVLNPQKDLIALHYDHAPDKDDGHSAAADRTILESMFGAGWIKEHVLPVSGAYGINKDTFRPESDAVMDAAWGKGGWLAAHTDKEGALAKMTEQWGRVLQAGGDVWVKEGGQSDLTAEVVKRIRATLPQVDTVNRIHVVQHSNWNENKTTPDALAYTKDNTDYIRIADANRYLNMRNGNEEFAKAAAGHPVFGPVWKAAFAYYDPAKRLDFSDTGELMRILGLGEIGIDEFRSRYLASPAAPSGDAP